MQLIQLFFLLCFIKETLSSRSLATDWTEERNNEPQTTLGTDGVCVLGCTPYVKFTTQGLAKYRKLVSDMVQDCDIIVHIGDTKSGRMPCNETLMTESLHILMDAARTEGTMVLYAAGDNEINDCHRFAPEAADFYRAADARQYLIDHLQLKLPTDLTGQHGVENHKMEGVIPGTTIPYSCEFDKYVATDQYAVATLEVLGSYNYLGDERHKHPLQDMVDPLRDRLELYLNANACALDWIEQSVNKAVAEGKKAVFFMLHAKFHTSNGAHPLGNRGVGDYYAAAKLGDVTEKLTGVRITNPYQPLFDK